MFENARFSDIYKINFIDIGVPEDYHYTNNNFDRLNYSYDTGHFFLIASH